MATSKTGSFWLTEALEVPIGSNTASGTIDLGAYVDVGDQQALSIEQVDFIYQWESLTGVFSYKLTDAFAGNAVCQAQLSDLNQGGLQVRADSHSLIAGGALLMSDAENIYSNEPDVYPDNFGKGSESRMVVNDQLYLEVYTNPVTVAAVWVTARIKCRIVKLSSKDWMSIAIQSTAADN